MKVQFDTNNQEDVQQARRLLGVLGPAGPCRSMTLDALSDLLAAQADRRKILCIKAIREAYGLGLKEAKEWVEKHLRM